MVPSMLNPKRVFKELAIGELPEGTITGRLGLNFSFVLIAVVKNMIKSNLGRKVSSWLTYPRT